MTTCVGTQILWDAKNAKMFGELCRRTSRFCEEGQPCPLTSADARILLVSSHRPLASGLCATQHRPRCSSLTGSPHRETPRPKCRGGIMSTNATASRTTTSTSTRTSTSTSTSTDDDYTTFSICSRWRLNAKPGSRVSCVGTSRPPDPGGRLVDKLRPEPGVMNIGWARLTGSPPARSSPRFIAKFVAPC